MTSEYEQRLASQKEQYETGEEIHDLPQIFHYWSHKYLRPKLEQIFDAASVPDFYANRFAELFRSGSERLKFVSIGSGDCNYEIEICEHLIALGHWNFDFIGLEVSDNLIKEAKDKIKRKGLNHCLDTQYFDVNRSVLDFPVHGFMAHHSLHHVVELERLFATVDKCLVPDGRFVSIDMIGRNGHMRWPETLGFIEALWNVIDDRKKYNHQLKAQHAKFLNFDCSAEGFEGIRAQDIMPLLVSSFSFNAFFAVGGLTEIFVDRGYGPNFDPNDAADLQFIDFVEQINMQLIEFGFIKPTMLFADMMKKGRAVRPRIIGNLTPEFCTRIPS